MIPALDGGLLRTHVFLDRKRLIRFTYFTGHQIDQLCGNADDLIRGVASGAKLIKEGAGQNFRAFLIGTHSLTSQP